MDLFGEKLKEIRLEKKLSVEQVARDTKIAKRYLDAIEENDFTVFPSETYLIGFLRTYTEYLGLDSTKYITQYKNYKIQEQPIPINELLDIKKKFPPVLTVALIALAVVAIAVLSIFGYRLFTNNTPQTVTNDKPQPTIQSDAKKYYFKDEISTEWFAKSDQIIIPLGATEYTIDIIEVAEPLILKLDGVTEYQLSKGNGITLNLNNDDSDDFRIVLNTIEEKDGRKQVNLGLYKVTLAVTGSKPVVQTGVVTVVPVNATATPVPLNVTTDVSAIYESFTPDPFVINVVFKGECLFRYLIDNKTRFQKYFLKDDKVDIDVSKTVTLWISNAGSVKATIAGKDIIFGRSGQVVTKQLQWRRDNETKKYKLEVTSIY